MRAHEYVMIEGETSRRENIEEDVQVRTKGKVCSGRDKVAHERCSRFTWKEASPVGVGQVLLACRRRCRSSAGLHARTGPHHPPRNPKIDFSETQCCAARSILKENGARAIPLIWVDTNKGNTHTNPMFGAGLSSRECKGGVDDLGDAASWSR